MRSQTDVGKDDVSPGPNRSPHVGACYLSRSPVNRTHTTLIRPERFGRSHSKNWRSFTTLLISESTKLLTCIVNILTTPFFKNALPGITFHVLKNVTKSIPGQPRKTLVIDLNNRYNQTGPDLPLAIWLPPHPSAQHPMTIGPGLYRAEAHLPLAP